MTETIDGLISEEEFSHVWRAQATACGELFTYADVQAQPIGKVWTVYEDGLIDEESCEDSNWYAMPGIVPSRALGYVVTEKAWTTETGHAIWYQDFDEQAREERKVLNRALIAAS